MARFLAWFAVGFALFFTAGGIIGRLNRIPATESIEAVAASHTALSTTDSDLTLSYVCKSHTYFTYYLSDQDHALIPDENLLEHPVIPRRMSYGDFETVFAAASGWELRGIVARAAGVTLERRDTVALLLGSLSGFYAGRWLFSTRLPACNAPEVLAQLQQISYWDVLKREKCKRLCLRYRLWFSRTKDEPLALEMEPILKSVYALNDKNVDDHNFKEVMLDRLTRFQKVFHAASSDLRLSEDDFAFLQWYAPDLLKGFSQRPELLKAAFAVHPPEFGFIVVNDDPEVVKRELADGMLPARFAKVDDLAYNRASIRFAYVIIGLVAVPLVLVGGYIAAVILLLFWVIILQLIGWVALPEDIKTLDTIVVPVGEKAFRRIFLGEQCWHVWLVPSSVHRQIKYVAAYRKTSARAITHIAPVESIVRKLPLGRGVVKFSQPPQEIGPIPVVAGGRVNSLHFVRYTTRDRLLGADNLDDAFAFNIMKPVKSE